MIVSLYRKRQKGCCIFIDSPGSDVPGRFKHRNILSEALEYQNLLESNPDLTHQMIATQFATQRERVAKLLSILSRLPNAFIEKAKDYPDAIIRVNEMAKLSQMNENIQKDQRISEILSKYKNQLPETSQ